MDASPRCRRALSARLEKQGRAEAGLAREELHVVLGEFVPRHVARGRRQRGDEEGVFRPRVAVLRQLEIDGLVATRVESHV